MSADMHSSLLQMGISLPRRSQASHNDGILDALSKVGQKVCKYLPHAGFDGCISQVAELNEENQRYQKDLHQHTATDIRECMEMHASRQQAIIAEKLASMHPTHQKMSDPISQVTSFHHIN